MRYRYTIVDMETTPIPPLEAGITGMEAIIKTMGMKSLGRIAEHYPHPPNAYTVAWILAESHAILHTAPETSWVEVVLATCSESVDQDLFVEIVKRRFDPKAVKVKHVEGSPPWVK